MAVGTACHSEGVGRFACAQAGCLDCLETLLRENKGLIQSVIQTQGMGGIDFLCCLPLAIKEDTINLE